MTQTLLFYTFATLTAASALGVVLSRNIVRTATCLLFTLLGVAALFILLDAEFLAAVQLLVYAGATLVLILFGVMLTSKNPFTSYQPSRLELLLSLTIAIIFFTSLTAAIHTLPSPPAASESSYSILFLGNALLTDYLIPFELSSLLLLLTMIGAAHLSNPRKPTSNQ
ncbi:MAG TPA: NADH-quinone oxidoreductase subunit J [Tepidisphaeraceae bacterium]|jgi:NADH-quinone oxidoreductase subunit J|nr:NADH-quinone oxidoreductase subunit J [Tepidisphaeraceae bacterium]